ncbi:MAG: dockerin type I repeat-containing protein [Saccharofermentans sp.]|nr:dockerin type I repeat-containing protein [Saccharofermentans sp.]
MKHIKKLIATILTVAAVFSTCTGTICAESDGRPEGTEMVDEWIDYVDLYYNLTYYVIVGDANEDYVVDQTDATLIMRYVLADSITPDWLPIIIWGKNLKVQHYYRAGFFPQEMDVDRNGKIEQTDATLLLRYLLWKESNQNNR